MWNWINVVDFCVQIFLVWIVKEELCILLLIVCIGGDFYLVCYYLYCFLFGVLICRFLNCLFWLLLLISYLRLIFFWLLVLLMCVLVVGEVVEMVGDIDGQCVQVEVFVLECGLVGCGGFDGFGWVGVLVILWVCVVMMVVNVVGWCVGQ